MPSVRTLTILGVTLAFVVCAFVPPSEANFRALAEKAKIAVENRTRTVIAGSSLPGSKEVKQAVALINVLSKDPQVTELVENASQGKSLTKGASLTTVAGVLGGLLPKSETVARNVMRRAATATREFPSKDWEVFLTSVADPALAEQLRRVDWAVRKGDARLCGEVVNTPLAGRGDLLALCLGLVTPESARCDQIGDDAPTLRAACEAEFDNPGADQVAGLRVL